jgi:hypothetical protein
MYFLVHVNGVVQSIFIDPNAKVTPNLSWQTPLVASLSLKHFNNPLTQLLTNNTSSTYKANIIS